MTKRESFIVLAVILLAIVIFLRGGAGTADSIEKSLAAIARPAAGEFAEPEAVIKAFINAVNDNDLDAGLKCFPIIESYRAHTAENYLQVMGSYKFGPDAPMPNFASREYQRAIISYFGYWDYYYLLLLTSSYPDLQNLRLNANDAQKKEKLEELSRMKPTKKIEINEISVIGSKKPNAIEEDMPASEIKFVLLKLKIGDMELPDVVVRVALIKDNWRIINMLNPI